MIRVKMMTLASTAIPMDRMIPAIPGRVSVTSKAAKRMMISATYTHTIPKPMTPAFKLVEMASCPSFAPTTLERSSSNSREREPIRMVEASLSASS